MLIPIRRSATIIREVLEWPKLYSVYRQLTAVGLIPMTLFGIEPN